MRLLYTINYNENEDENEKRPHRSRHEHKCSKCKKCFSMMMLICIKQHLNNTWNSIHKKVKQRLGWFEKSVTYKKSVY